MRIMGLMAKVYGVKMTVIYPNGDQERKDFDGAFLIYGDAKKEMHRQVIRLLDKLCWTVDMTKLRSDIVDIDTGTIKFTFEIVELTKKEDDIKLFD
jgi:hypothetical protein